MVPSTEQTAPSRIGRREAIRRAALLAGVVALAGMADRSSIRRPAPAAQGSRLTPAHAAIAGAVADRILPRTDTPGAADVGVPAFIDLLYGEFMTAGRAADAHRRSDRRRRRGEVRAWRGVQHPHRRSPGRRCCAAIARAEEGRDQGFFRLIRSATILGYFTSEQVGRNVLHYDPVPGRYDGCVPIDQVGRRNWTT